MEYSQLMYEYLNEHKSYLEKNDLLGFYRDSNDTTYEIGREIGRFLEENGIIFENYFKDTIPKYFGYIPSYWFQEGTVVVPPQIKKLEQSAFEESDGFIGDEDGKPFFIFDAGSVEVFDQFVIDDTDCEEVVLGSNLKSIHDYTFQSCRRLKKIHVPQNIWDDEAMRTRLEDVVKYCRAEPQPEIEVY